MNIKKAVSALAAAVVAVTMSAVSVFAETTIQLDSDYAGNWGAGAYIPKDELDAIGGDVKITLKVETVEPGNEKQFLVTPMDYSAPGWPRITNKCTGDNIIAKEDQFIVLVQGEDTVEFVVPEDVIAGLTDKDGECGIGFQVCNVIVKSAKLEAGESQKANRIIDDDNVIPYCFGEYEMPEEAAEPAAEETAAAEEAETTSPKTGNTSAAVLVCITALAGTAALAASKRK
ncbi:hypothetical protein [Huintestinicola sp.]|uniref:hypothetical protein n=1 Tax=Huintestinicola sp. TaxID=2981661 RepID=UPI003D7D7040